MEGITQELLIALVSIVGGVAGVYIRKMLAETKDKKQDLLSTAAWIAIRSARDQIKGDNKGEKKFSIALKILKSTVGGKEEILEDAIRAAYQNMKSLHPQ